MSVVEIPLESEEPTDIISENIPEKENNSEEIPEKEEKEEK